MALEAARNVSLGRVTVSTEDFDFLDLDAMAEKLGAEESLPTAAEETDSPRSGKD